MFYYEIKYSHRSGVLVIRKPPFIRKPPLLGTNFVQGGAFLKLNLRKSGGNEEKVKEKAPQAKKIAFWAPRRGAKTSKMKEKVMKIGQKAISEAEF